MFNCSWQTTFTICILFTILTEKTIGYVWRGIKTNPRPKYSTTLRRHPRDPPQTKTFGDKDRLAFIQKSLLLLFHKDSHKENPLLLVHKDSYEESPLLLFHRTVIKCPLNPTKGRQILVSFRTKVYEGIRVFSRVKILVSGMLDLSTFVSVFMCNSDILFDTCNISWIH